MNEIQNSTPEQVDQQPKKKSPITANAAYKGGMEKTTELLLESGITSEHERTSLLVATAIILYPENIRIIMLDYQLTPESIKRNIAFVAENKELQKTLDSTFASLARVGTITINSDLIYRKNVEQTPTQPSIVEKPKVKKEKSKTKTDESYRSADVVYKTEISTKLSPREKTVDVLEEHLLEFPNIPINFEVIGAASNVTKQRIGQLINHDDKFKEMLIARGLKLTKKEGERSWKVEKIVQQ